MQRSLDRLRQRREERGDEGGFTLIELLIVIVILGILAAIVVFAVQNLSGTSAQASCRSDYKTVETAVEAYKAQMGNYPDGSTTGGTGVQTDADATTVNAASATQASGSELLQTGNTTTGVTTGTGNPNSVGGTGVGPWLRDVPQNSGHYTIFAANDGSGDVSVYDSAGTALVGAANTQSACSSVK